MDQVLESLRRFDTPTICNALELLDPARKDFGYTNFSFNCVNPCAGPVVGVARTSAIRSLRPSGRPDDRLKQERLKYYEYMEAVNDIPTVAVMQDLDGSCAGKGPFWGEFNVRIHLSLGCKAVITDGSVRDVGVLPTNMLILSAGLRPSHAHVHLVAFAEQVNVFGMIVASGDMIHADQHGAVCFASDLCEPLVRAAERFVESERPILEACGEKRVSFEELRTLYLQRSQ